MSDSPNELKNDIDRLKLRVIASAKSYTELSTVTNSIIDSLEKRLALAFEKIEQFELERVELKKHVKDLSLYLQVQAI
jgi:hypothetical protein